MENDEERRLRPSQGISSEREGSPEPLQWIAGVFYFNRNDPHLLVPRRSGLGITLNFGHPLSWWLAGVLAVVLAGIELVSFLSTHKFINLLLLVFFLLLFLILLIGYLRNRTLGKL